MITYTVTGTVSWTATVAFEYGQGYRSQRSHAPALGHRQRQPADDHKSTTSAVQASSGSTGNVAAGRTLVYTIVVSNTGPGSLSDATVDDPFPANLTNVSYTW